MDFAELEAIEGLRWPWNSWPTPPSSSDSLPIPLSVMCTPLMHQPELPVLPYDPVLCAHCGAALNPYARVHYTSRIWTCPFCLRRNPYAAPHSDGTNLPAELFPTYSAVEYRCSGDGASASPAFVFVVDVASSSAEEELRALKGELLRVVERLPESVLVGLITFDSMVRVHDLGFGECSRAVLLRGDREVSADQTQRFLGLKHTKHMQQYLLPISECDFNVTTAIDEIRPSREAARGQRAGRCTGAAISAAVALLEGCSVTTGSRVMVFTSGPATRGPGMVVDPDLGRSIRTHRDLINGSAQHYAKSCRFYERLSTRLAGSSIVLDLFACSLDQTGAAEMKPAVERSGGFMLLSDSFDSAQFRGCLSHVFAREQNDPKKLAMCLDATIELVTTADLKISGALGPCVSLRKSSSLVDDCETGEGGTRAWRLASLSENTCLAFFFRAHPGRDPSPGSAFLLQISTRYRTGSEIRKRVVTAARRWVAKGSPEVAAGFDQEAAAAVTARLAVHRLESGHHLREVIRRLDDSLIRFAADFGDYSPEDPSTFRLAPNLSLYPQFLYHLRRSQFVEVFNTVPDETAHARLALLREGVAGSTVMIQPMLTEYSFDGPPAPALLDIRSVTPDSILLFDSYFCVVIHYGTKIARWRKLGYDRDPAQENLRKLLEAPEADAAALVAERVPAPRFLRCDQHSSEARFLLAKLNPSVTHNTTHTGGSDLVLTDDLSLEAFLDHLQVLAVQG